MKKRETWLDIAKGIGIISVVIGHSGNPIAHQYLFWFHMPLFFILSGYLFKKIEDPLDLRLWIKRRSTQLLIPYASFGILISIIMFFLNFSVINFLKSIIKLIYGGEVLGGIYGVFWFITCLYLTQIMFSVLLTYIKKTYVQISIIVLFYLLAHLIAMVPFLKDLKTPWNFDIAFISIAYYAIGYYGKAYLKIIIQKTLILYASITLASITIVLNLMNNINFTIDMKVNIYSPILLDILIPLLFSLCIFTISYRISLLESKTIFEYLGTASLTLMYLHIPVNTFFQGAVGSYNVIIYSLVGILAPLIIHYFIFDNYNITRKMFLGIPTKQPQQERVQVAS